MILAQITADSAVTTGGGVIALIVGLIVKDFFMEKKRVIREDTKVDELGKQTALLSELVVLMKKRNKKSREQHKQTHDLLNQVLQKQQQNK